MQTQMILSVGTIFAAVFLAGLGVQYLLRDLQARRVQRRLNEIARSEVQPVDPTILRDLKLSTVPGLDALLRHLRFVPKIERLLQQADSSLSVSTVLFLTGTLGLGGGLLAFQLGHSLWFALPATVILGSLPLLVLSGKKRQRVHRFEAQLPDSLDLITGALRAGMAFTGALQLVAEESPDPIGKEFMIVFEEHRLGLSLEESLHKMTERVDTRELQLFVAAVLLQRETGGNLGEILEGSAEIIRDRFRILGDVRTITAQARLSGAILVFLPLVMAIFLSITAPDYMQVLTNDPLGRIMLGTAVGLQFIGILAIRRIIAIKV